MGFTVVVPKSEVEDPAHLNRLVSDFSVISVDSNTTLLISPLPGKLIDVLKVLTDQKIQYELRSESNLRKG